jgi:hypothetical protein
MSATIYKSDAALLAEVLSQFGFYSLAPGDGCLCAHLHMCRIEIDVHCWKTSRQCECRWAGIHITPTNSADEQELIKIGEIIRGEMERPDMNIKIIIHEASSASSYVGYVKPKEGERREVVVPSPMPDEGFQFDDGEPSEKKK